MVVVLGHGPHPAAMCMHPKLRCGLFQGVLENPLAGTLGRGGFFRLSDDEGRSEVGRAGRASFLL